MARRILIDIEPESELRAIRQALRYREVGFINPLCFLVLPCLFPSGLRKLFCKEVEWIGWLWKFPAHLRSNLRDLLHADLCLSSEFSAIPYETLPPLQYCRHLRKFS